MSTKKDNDAKEAMQYLLDLEQEAFGEAMKEVKLPSLFEVLKRQAKSDRAAGKLHYADDILDLFYSQPGILN
jgi:hypothetical protein